MHGRQDVHRLEYMMAKSDLGQLLRKQGKAKYVITVNRSCRSHLMVPLASFWDLLETYLIRRHATPSSNAFRRSNLNVNAHRSGSVPANSEAED